MPRPISHSLWKGCATDVHLWECLCARSCVGVSEVNLVNPNTGENVLFLQTSWTSLLNVTSHKRHRDADAITETQKVPSWSSKISVMCTRCTIFTVNNTKYNRNLWLISWRYNWTVWSSQSTVSDRKTTLTYRDVTVLCVPGHRI